MQLSQARAQGLRHGSQVSCQRFCHEHLFALRWCQRHELDLEGKSSQCSLVNPIQQIGGADKDAIVALHALQHFVHLGHFVGTLGRASILQKAVCFVQKQDRFFGFGLFEHGSHVLLGFTHKLADQIARSLNDERFVNCPGNVFGQGSFSSPRRPVKTQATVASSFEGFDNTGNCKPSLHVQHVQVVGGHARALAAAPCFVTQGQISILKLPLNQAF